jgi:Domain of unknown function (DUF4383)
MKTTTPRHMAVHGAALLIACVFLTVGLLGFIPGVTTDYGLLQWAGHQPGAKVFGVFAVSGVHNVVHLAFGSVGLILTRTYAAARAYLLGGGLAYLALWAAEFFIDHSKANFGPLTCRPLAALRARGGHGDTRHHARRPARPDQAPPHERLTEIGSGATRLTSRCRQGCRAR